MQRRKHDVPWRKYEGKSKEVIQSVKCSFYTDVDPNGNWCVFSRFNIVANFGVGDDAYCRAAEHADRLNRTQ